MASFFQKYNTILLALFCIVLLMYIFQWVDFLHINDYVRECFTNDTSHSVDLPLTTKYSCKNFCGPAARCSITGQQCTADIDCTGCQPYSPPLPKSSDNVPGDNSGSKLTNGYGTDEKIVTNNLYAKPAMPSFGVDTWSDEFKEENDIFDKRYKPKNLENMPDYPKRYSLTGQFIEDGPFASNSELY